MRALRVVLLLVLLGTLAAVALAQGGAPRQEHEHGHEAPEAGVHEHEHGQEAPEAGVHEHEHGQEAPEPGVHEHEHGQEAPEAGEHEHEHGHEAKEAGEHGHDHVHGEGEDEHSHLPIQMYAIKAYFQAPWRDSTQPGRIALQAGLLALVDAALLAWLWRRWWR